MFYRCFAPTSTALCIQLLIIQTFSSPSAPSNLFPLAKKKKSHKRISQLFLPTLPKKNIKFFFATLRHYRENSRFFIFIIIILPTILPASYYHLQQPPHFFYTKALCKVEDLCLSLSSSFLFPPKSVHSHTLNQTNISIFPVHYTFSSSLSLHQLLLQQLMVFFSFNNILLSRLLFFLHHHYHHVCY